MNSQVTEAYPLTWPRGWKRAIVPGKARYGEWTISQAVKEVYAEIRLLGGSKVIISSNLTLNLDGSIRGGQAQPNDRGVALYFTRGKNALCFACDKWNKVEHNIRAIALAVHSLRQLDRCGSSEILDRAFTGFIGLPAPVEPPWYVNVSQDAPVSIVHAAYRERVKVLHPDRGGSHEGFIQAQRAWETFRKERGLEL